MADKPTIHILGSGALGSLWATKLSRNNNVILLIKGSKLSTSNKTHQFQFIDQEQSTTLTFPCEPSVSSSESNPPIDILLVFTKSYDTLSAIQQLKNRISPSTRIVLFQNGMGSQQAIAQLLPQTSLYAASTTEGANRPDPQTVIYAGEGETWFGAISTAHSLDEPKKILSLLSSSGLKVFHTQNIWQKLWFKLAVNCAINPFTALLNCKNGELIGQPLFDTHITPLCHELSHAMKLNNIEASPAELQSIVEDVIKRTANNVSSMLQDVRATKQTEIEYINGYIESIAQQNNQYFPVNFSLLEKVKRLREDA
ncbi:2-dehydropantoate 2-reductase [Alkalimarinus alittae]|uniref:2-dehydropantoate 2-reductase n=1 Tax=Alkalimarinus alittae TaxID=2961619 RepID=A0ABY6MYS1_9ALTE|nr:2-dehydropantoate 2-reductase [Alkalimarinus alittae]UZE94985.1 2-dehydropantoate 2-reductase [Alkalimarinus alittae]